MSRWLPSLLALAAAGVHARGLCLGAEVAASSTQRELFGFERAPEISTRPAGEIAEVAKAWGQNDDITVVTVRRNS